MMNLLKRLMPGKRISRERCRVVVSRLNNVHIEVVHDKCLGSDARIGSLSSKRDGLSGEQAWDLMERMCDSHPPEHYRMKRDPRANEIVLNYTIRPDPVKMPLRYDSCKARLSYR